MNIELHGASAENFGAELMLRAVVDELSTRVDGPTFAMVPAEGDLALRGSLGVLALMPSDGRPGTARALPVRAARLARGRWGAFQRCYGLMDGGRVDAIVDLSGFRLSDQWGRGAAEAFARITKAYARQGAPVLLLPQAFGPFEDPEVADAAGRALESTTVVYARDQISAHHVRGLGADIDLRLAPDITLGYGHPSSEASLESAPISIVPNARMLDRPGHEWSADRYLDTVHVILEQVVRSGRGVQFLLHTKEQADEDIASTLMRSTSAEIAIVRPRSAREAKALLASSWAVIGSRYHALAGALSASRPTIGIGWSHKYRGLFTDFGVEQFLISPSTGPSEIAGLVDEVLGRESSVAISTHLAGQLELISDRTEQTWLTVVEFLGR